MVQQRVISRETPGSREIEKVMYLPIREDLWVYFRNGAVSVYSGVDSAMWDEFEATPSKEEFVHGLTSFKVLVPRKRPD